AVRSLEALPDLGPAATRVRILAALADLVRGLLRHAPVVLVLEDLDRADALSLDALAHLVRSVAGAGDPARATAAGGVGRLAAGSALLVLASLDPERSRLARAATAALEAEGRLAPVPLGPLTLPQTTLLAASMLGAELVDPRLAEALHDAGGGVPFEIEE